MPKQDTTKSSHKDTPTTTAAFREYSNQHFGTYYSHKVDDVYEAMYVAKYPKRITPTIDLKTDKQAVLKIAKYRLAARNNSDIQDVLTDFRVQFVDPRKPTTFLPKFAYVKHTSGSWAPVVLPEALEKRARKTTAPQASKKTGGEPVSRFQKVGTDVLRQIRRVNALKPVSDTENAYAPKQQANPASPNINAIVKADINALKEKLMSSSESKEAFEKVGQVLKLFKKTDLVKDVMKRFNENDPVITPLAELMETDSVQAFLILNKTVLPSFDLIDTVCGLVRAQIATKTTGGAPVEDHSSDSGTEDEDVDADFTPYATDAYEGYADMILNGKIEDSDLDDDFDPTEEAELFLKDHLDTDKYQTWYIEKRNQSNANRIFVYFCYVLMMIFALVVAKAGFNAATPVFYKVDANRALKEAPSGDSSSVFTDPLQNYTVELPIENDAPQGSWFGTMSSPANVKISLVMPSDTGVNNDDVTDYLKKYVTPPSSPKQESQMTSCVLTGKPSDVLSLGQQLFARNEMTLQYYIEMLKHNSDKLTELKGVDIDDLKGYVHAVKTKDFMTKIIDGFNAFAKEMTTKEAIETKFTDILTKPETEAYKHRMNTFKDTLIRHVEGYGKGMALEHSCSLGDQNYIKFTLNHYTQGLLMDLRLNYKNMAQRQVDMFVDTMPIFKEIFNAYVRTLELEEVAKKDIDALGSIQLDVNNVKELINKNPAFDKIPSLKAIKDLVNVQDIEAKIKLEAIIEKIRQISDQHKIIIDKLQMQTEYKEYYTSVFDLTASAADRAAETIFRPFATLADIEVDASHVVPNIQDSFMTTLDLMVESIHSSLVHTDDKNTIMYVAASKTSQIIYNLIRKLSTNSVLSNAVFDDISKFPGSATAAAVVNNLMRYAMSTMDKQDQRFVIITQSAMKIMSTKKDIIQNRLNDMHITDSVMNLDGVYLLGKMVLNGVKGEIAQMGKEGVMHLARLSKSYIDMQIEVQKRELALIIFHLQNNILQGPQKIPGIGEIKLSNDHYFFSKYYEQTEYAEKYGSQIVQRLVNIMGLSFVKNAPIEKMFQENTSSIMGGAGYTESEGEGSNAAFEDQFIDAFIENAKQHNKTVLGKLRTQKDIDMRLKKKLLKSYIKHNPHMIRKLTKYLAGGAKLF